MSTETALVQWSAPLPALPQFTVLPMAIQARDEALAKAAVVGKVTNPVEQDKAVDAQKALKQLSNAFERQRKAFKEPFIEAGRVIDRAVEAEKKELDEEYGRISNLVSEHQLAEQRRIRDEEEAQRRELERIEREKQAELDRIAKEQSDKERIAKEKAEAAAALAAAAKGKAAKEAARRAQDEAEACRLQAEQDAQKAAQASNAVQERASELAYVESRPIQQSRSSGQRMASDWEINVVNPYELAKYHPDCVNITARLSEIKARLNQGLEVKGVTAKKIIKAGVIAGRERAAIDV